MPNGYGTPTSPQAVSQPGSPIAGAGSAGAAKAELTTMSRSASAMDAVVEVAAMDRLAMDDLYDLNLALYLSQVTSSAYLHLHCSTVLCSTTSLMHSTL